MTESPRRVNRKYKEAFVNVNAWGTAVDKDWGVSTLGIYDYREAGYICEIQNRCEGKDLIRPLVHDGVKERRNLSYRIVDFNTM